MSHTFIYTCTIAVLNTCLCTYLYSVGTYHENLLKSQIICDWVTYFTLWVYMGNCVSQN